MIRVYSLRVKHGAKVLLFFHIRNILTQKTAFFLTFCSFYACFEYIFIKKCHPYAIMHTGGIFCIFTKKLVFKCSFRTNRGYQMAQKSWLAKT